MGTYLYYIIAIVGAALMFGTYFLIYKKANTKLELTHKILSWVLFTIFSVWFMFAGGGTYRSIIALQYNSPFVNITEKVGTIKFLTLISLLGMWLFYTTHIISLLAPFFKFPIMKRMERIVAPILVCYVLLALPFILYGYTSTFNITIAGVLYSVEVGLLVGKYFYQVFFEKFDYKIHKHEVVEFILCIIGAILFAMPSPMPRALFGNPRTFGQVMGFATYHRYYIYCSLIFLVGFSLLLRNRKGEYARMIMLFVAMGGMISFSDGYTWNIFKTPYDWPLHICNTAMFILPIAIASRSQKVFYFTFFVNILGAGIATFMPVYGEGLAWNSVRVVGFFINHIEAMAMPFVLVLTDVFPRPQKKQFFYSMVGFSIYYVAMIVCNTWFKAVWPTHDIDFFFINDTFVTEKFHANGLLENFKFQFDINGKHFTMYPLYQTIFYFGFVALSIGMWYFYVFIFKFQDYLIYLNERNKKMKLDALALQTKCRQKEVKKCMNPESVNKLVISHFGKQYSKKSPFVVRDINFTANSGEIIGFLGPNGAGKSTTIKAIVGIHLPTEGNIEVNGYDVAVQPVLAKAQIGFVPDHYALYENLTGREYLNYIADLYEVSEEDTNKFMDEFLETLAMKDAIDNKIQTYSHGMKQKIAIMASIIHNPKVWILDEPLTGLDPVSIYQVKQCLKRHAEQGNIVFFSSHLIDIVEKLCDKILIISDHKIVDVANVKELLDKGVNLEQYYMDKTGLATGN